jgi:hypothetical protein
MRTMTESRRRPVHLVAVADNAGIDALIKVLEQPAERWDEYGIICLVVALIRRLQIAENLDGVDEEVKAFYHTLDKMPPHKADCREHAHLS